jgi:hypothetical protein
MNRRGFLRSALMSAAFIGLSRVLPGSQTEFLSVAAPVRHRGVTIDDFNQAWEEVMPQCLSEMRAYLASESVFYKYLREG